MSDHAGRRRRLLRRLGGGVALLTTAPVTTYSNDVENTFRPDNDFYYMTGFDEPEAAALLTPGNRRGRYWLLVRPRDPDQEVWLGPRTGLQGVRDDHGAQVSRPISKLEQTLEEVLDGAPSLSYLKGRYPDMDRLVQRVLRRLQRTRGRRAPRVVNDLAPTVHEMRLVKEAAELKLMRKAAAITTQAHVVAMSFVEPGVYEYQVQAVLEYQFRHRGASGPAYPSIVGSGKNACTLHYTANNCRLRSGELLLVDAGCESGFYNADVTRTMPVSGRFTKEQRAAYEIVLAAQEAAIAAVRPGAVFNAPHQAAVQVLVQGMLDLGLAKGDPGEVMETGFYRRYYMHSTSHWLGMDVHDVGESVRNGRSRRLVPGMVLTVEPGLYVPAADRQAPPALRGLGIRIEDDVLVTRSGREVLSSAAPKKPELVERAVRNRVLRPRGRQSKKRSTRKKD